MKARITEFTANCNVLEDYFHYGDIKIMKHAFEEISGKKAAICYMSDDYESIEKESMEKSIKRFNRTIDNGHHSIADHCYITVVFEEVPKMLAMILNSLQVYATSEKSARYTVMKNLSKEEQTLYDKWKNKLIPLFIEEGVDEKQAVKLAQENARYFISIFSPATTFAYTTSFRQWNYINHWFNNLLNDEKFMTLNEECDSYNIFKSHLADCMEDFTEWFEQSIIYNEHIKDQKNRRLEFLKPIYGRFSGPYTIYGEDYFGDVYQVHYDVSFAALAQLQRHRTLKYIIETIPEFNLDRLCEDKGPAFNFTIFTPDLFDRSDRIPLQIEWFKDMRSVLHLFPQGLVVGVKEMGIVDDFLLKCDERLCGRTQYETMTICREILHRMYCEAEFTMSTETCNHIANWIEMIYTDENGPSFPKPKCMVRKDGCPEGGCFHGPKHALDRTF